jgi:peptidoglycan/LPS O-acetylase OafA/YrhL
VSSEVGAAPPRTGSAGSADAAQFRLGYRPALDGIRAIGILLVVIFHTLTFLVDWYGIRGWHLFRGGSIGVDIFFTLSGFLITSLLLQEWREHRSISFGRFYARRALRLLPALWVTLALLLAYLAIEKPGGTTGLAHGIIEILTYANNFFVGHNPFLTQWFGQAWSLAIEEQFYIAWPALLMGLLLLFRRRPAVIAGLLAAAVVGVSLWRVELFRTHRFIWSDVYFRTDARVDQLLIGALVAFLLHFGYVRVKARPWVAIAGLLLSFGLAQAWWSYQREYFYMGAPLAMVAACALILGVIDNTGPVAWLLAIPPMRWLGRVSYTLYLVHVPVYAAVLAHYGTRRGVNLDKVVIANVIAFGITAAIHHGIERPANRFKSRFSRIRQTTDEASAAAAL